MTVDAGRRVLYRAEPWELDELLPDAEPGTLDSRLEAIEAQVHELESARPELGPEIPRARLLEIFRLYERIVTGMAVLESYGSLWFAADTQSSPALTFRNRIESALTRLANRVLFLSLWWKGLEDEAAARLLPASEDPDLGHYLEDLRRARPYTLDESAERIINLKDQNGIGAVLTLYSMVTNRLEFELEVDGAKRKMTRAELTAHVYSPDGHLRERALRELLAVYEREAPVLAQIYANRVQDWAAEQVELRGFDSPIAVRNLANDVPAAAVETLLDACSEGTELFRRYFRWKAARLGVPRLRRYDLYAPLGASSREVPYSEAVRLVLSTFTGFDAGFAARAERVFAERHVDAEIRKGKKGGAFCATVLPSLTPWVLLNYTGRVRDVATMAHELGHAVHSLLASEHSILTQHASLPLAETASVFAERLLVDRLLAEEDDADVRRELLASSLDDVYATVIRQAYFVRFEIAAHEAVLAGQPPEALDRLYLAGLEEQFGDSVEVPEAFRREWISIPHIFQSPFYCYAYSFGQLLVLALYRRYQEEGAAFVPGYLRLLAHGGSARPAEILAEAGVDMTDREFWRGGFAVVADLLDQLEAL